MNALNLINSNGWLPVIFLILMGIAVLAYVVLDGYDLGVGILVPWVQDEERDIMISSIGPFWDANETWLVLGVGLLLVAFPMAHGAILTALYVPVLFMLLGLILRGCAFDFRVKAQDQHKSMWTALFSTGSWITALAQGFMLGWWIIGFKDDVYGYAFASLVGICLVAGYSLMGSTWLIMKTVGQLQKKALLLGRKSILLTALGVGAVSVATPLVSPRVYDLWFSAPQIYWLWVVPVLTLILFFVCYCGLNATQKHLQLQNKEHRIWVPFTAAVGIFALSFLGLAYSLFPYLVIDKLTIWQAASSPEALQIILIGALIVVPCILAYTAFSYYVFWGKAQKLEY